MITKLLRNTNDKVVFTIIGIIIPLFIVIPIIYIVIQSFGPASIYFQTIVSNNDLYQSILTTFELIIKVGLLASTIGFSLAYIVTFNDLKFRRILNILFIIPLGIPVYVAAYTYTNIYHYLPVLEKLLKTEFLMNGSVFIYAMFLYPYVYIASKSYLSKHLTDYLEASSTLGISRTKTLFRVILPLSRPVIIGSALFVIFESLSDFAVVEYYGVLSLSRYVNLAWFSSGDFISAAKFSVYILFIMFLLIFTERIQRRKKRYTSADIIQRPIKKIQPNIFGQTVMYGYILIIVLLGTIFPVTQMLVSVFNNTEYIPRLDIFEVTFNTLQVTIITIIIIICTALLLTTLTIHLKNTKKHIVSSISALGYMVPSMVLALGVYVVFIHFDRQLYYLLKGVGLDRMLITSTITIVIIGFFIKFFSIGYTNLLSAYQKIDKNLLEASETLGENKLSTMSRVSIPMLQKSIFAVTIILSIDILKELTIVYSLKPFNFKTLSTEVYRYAGNEMINIAAFPSLIIVGICILLIIYLEEGFKK